MHAQVCLIGMAYQKARFPMFVGPTKRFEAKSFADFDDLAIYAYNFRCLVSKIGNFHADNDNNNDDRHTTAYSTSCTCMWGN